MHRSVSKGFQEDQLEFKFNLIHPFVGGLYLCFMESDFWI